MTEQQDTREKWGKFNITDEQAERINNGDVEEFDLFFLRNYEYIKKRCTKELHRSGCDLLPTPEDAINATYIDLRNTKFSSWYALESTIRRASVHSYHSSSDIAVKLSPAVYNSLKFGFRCESPYIVNEKGHITHKLDLYNSAPSPQEEIDEETRFSLLNNVEKLTEAVSPFLTPSLLRIFPLWLCKIPYEKAAERLGMNSKSLNRRYTDIRYRLILNYDGVIKRLSDFGYNVREYVGVIPSDYSYLQKRAEEIKAYKADYIRKWRANKLNTS
ncbi:MAG: hypothetical protein IKA62_05455 [Clostridia bacterium]|nr:hypothetical protein [Clostridia bacterium]